MTVGTVTVKLPEDLAPPCSNQVVFDQNRLNFVLELGQGPYGHTF
jgi:hypothetical protein